jgi:hypothetical protein
MKTIILFKPTGEVNAPEKGQWYFDNSPGIDMIIQCNSSKPGGYAFYLYERVEIEIPEKTDSFVYSFWKFEGNVCLGNGFIDFKKPEVKKVKKWIWETHSFNANDGILYTVTTDKRYTEEEMEKAGNILRSDSWHKVEGSEIEVEE